MILSCGVQESHVANFRCVLRELDIDPCHNIAEWPVLKRPARTLSASELITIETSDLAYPTSLKLFEPDPHTYRISGPQNMFSNQRSVAE